LAKAVLVSITPGSRSLRFLCRLSSAAATPRSSISGKPGRILIIGLNGSGKTTRWSCAMLQETRSAACADRLRFATTGGDRQLVTLERNRPFRFFTPDPNEKNVERAAAAALVGRLPPAAFARLRRAKGHGGQASSDTAGRQEIDAALIEELKHSRFFTAAGNASCRRRRHRPTSSQRRERSRRVTNHRNHFDEA